MSDNVPGPVSVQVDSLSLCAHRVTVEGASGLHMSDASSFTMKHESIVYFVTNWHVVKGLSPETNQPIREDGHAPTALKFHLHKSLHWRPTVRIPLYDDDSRPQWIEHPTLGGKFDVVALAIHAADLKGLAKPLNETKHYPDMATWPGMEVAIVGFPLGFSGPATLPIWKTGHIATDANIDCKEGPCFYVDGTMRAGMSGAPVFLSQAGGYQSESGDYHMWPGVRCTRWLGVYAGRIHADADIGRVWKADEVRRVIIDGVRPE